MDIIDQAKRLAHDIERDVDHLDRLTDDLVRLLNEADRRVDAAERALERPVDPGFSNWRDWWTWGDDYLRDCRGHWDGMRDGRDRERFHGRIRDCLH